MTAPNPRGFRFSETFINRWTRILIIAMIGLPLIGIGLGVSSDGDWAPDWLSTFALVFTIVGFVGPILIAAIMGGESITRGGGLVGALFTYGLIGGPTGQVLEIGWLEWTGYAALAIATIGFFVIGWRANVDMYIGTPNARIMTIRRKPTSHRAGPTPFEDDDPRLRVQRPPDEKAKKAPRR
ncbi:MAG: hypothetical protein QOJ72_834 [Nocardioidaceae bacterium]|jgi:hypothetical protein|nr:hypothetical protein [Nocardioidaceae bacterium]